MSISLNIRPAADTFQSVYRPIYIKITRTGGADTILYIYPYVDEAYINVNMGVDFTLGTAEWLYNLQDWLSNYVSYDLVTLGQATQFKEATNSMKKVGFSGVSYPSGSDVIAYNSALDFFVLNAPLQQRETQDFLAFVCDGSTKRFLTNQPYYNPYSKKKKIRVTDSEFMGVITDDNFTADDLLLEIEEVTAAGNVYSSIIVTPDDSSYNPIARWSLGVGCANLNAATLESGSQPVIDADTISYSVRLKDGTGANMSGVYGWTLDHNCHNVIRRFHWLNRLGAIDSFNFTANESITQSVEHINYIQNLPYTPVQNSDNTYDFNISDRGLTTLAVNSSQQLMTYSQIVTDPERIWLQELLSSPNVWTEEEDGDGDMAYSPIVIADAETMIYDEANNLFTFSFTFIYANSTIIQGN